MALNPLAYYDMAAGVGQNIVAGQQRGQQNALMMHELELGAAQRSALGNYLSAPEGERASAFSDLVAQSPERAANILAIENAQAEQAQAERQRHAREAIPLLQHILRSENPEIAGDLLASSPEENNPLHGLLQSLHQQGAINLDDGVSADEWRQIADLGIAHLTPIAYVNAERADSPFAKVNPSDYTPESVAAFQQSGGRNFGLLESAGEEDSLTRKLDVVEDRLGRLLTSEEVMKLSGGGTTINIGDNEENKPIPVTQLPNVRLPDGSTPPLGTTFGQAEKAGARVFSTDELKRQQDMEGALATLDSLQELALGKNGVFVDAGGSALTNNFLARTANGVGNAIGAFFGTEDSVRRSVFSDTAQGTISSLARSMGNAGALSDGDVARAIALIPALGAVPVTEREAKAKFDELRAIFSRGASRLSPGGNSGGAVEDLGAGVTVEWLD